MYRLTIMICFASIFVAQNVIDFGSKPSKQGKVALGKPIEIIDEGEGFYDETFTTIAENGTIFVMDVGNKLILRYSKSGKEEASFGKAGNGPGELNNFVSGMVAANDLLLVRGGNKIQLFTYSGDLIAEIADFALTFSYIEFDEKNIYFYSLPSSISKNTLVVYSKKGEKVKEVPSTEFDEAEAAAMFQQGGFDDKKVKSMLKLPTSMARLNKDFVVGYGGDYRLTLIGENHALKKTYRRDYERQKINDVLDILPRSQRKMYESNKNNDQFKQIFMQIVNNFKDNMGGYLGDVTKILGTHKGYMFIQTSAESIHTIRIDVISPDEKLVSTIKLDTDNQLLSTAFEHGKLIANYTNEEQGPFVKIYPIAIK